tara:strand:- start:65 stop:475 length:411 start_codon:yes stop_codon:yes gene_type:complete
MPANLRKAGISYPQPYYNQRGQRVPGMTYAQPGTETGDDKSFTESFTEARTSGTGDFTHDGATHSTAVKTEPPTDTGFIPQTAMTDDQLSQKAYGPTGMPQSVQGVTGSKAPGMIDTPVVDSTTAEQIKQRLGGRI